jgi:acetyltransferase-like isoleucine patch superfamily enzyme
VNSVATKEMEAYTVYQGNPAVFVRERIKEEIAAPV